MKKYLQPMTGMMPIHTQVVICASAPSAPGRSGQLGTMTVAAGQWT